MKTTPRRLILISLALFIAAVAGGLRVRRRPTQVQDSLRLTQAEFVLLDEKAQKGDEAAFIRICDYFSWYVGDEAKLVEWLKTLAEKGNVTAQFNLGYYYQQPCCKDLKLAVYWLDCASTAGYPGASDRLAEARAKLSKNE